MVDSLERAVQAIDYLNAIVCRIDADASRFDSQPERSDAVEEVTARNVQEDFVVACREVIQATLAALSSIDRSVYRFPPRQPPKWWRNLSMLVAQKRREYTKSHPALVDAFDVLDRHVRDEDGRLGLIVFLVDRLDLKIVGSGSAYGFRTRCNPYPYRVGFAFDPQVDDQIDEPLRELLR